MLKKKSFTLVALSLSVPCRRSSVWEQNFCETNVCFSPFGFSPKGRGDFVESLEPSVLSFWDGEGANFCLRMCYVYQLYHGDFPN